MDSFPRVEVEFIVEGKYFDLELFTKEMGILPTKTRGINDWPSTIKNNLNISEELRPRYIWCINQTEEQCKTVAIPIKNIISQLIGKEQKINLFCKKYELEKGLIIIIHAETMNLPEISLSPKIVSYFGNLKAQISFDIYTY